MLKSKCRVASTLFSLQFLLYSFLRFNMALGKIYRMDLKRRFSISCQNWTDKNIETYEKKREWKEAVDIRRIFKERKNIRRQEEMGTDMRDRAVLALNRIGRILKYKGEFTKYFEELQVKHESLLQTYIREREDILGPDLAVANFIISRGGSVKFWRDNEWYDRKNPRTRFPRIYVPGYYIEGINAFGMQLRQEGLESIRRLNKLKWLSLKESVYLNDFALDFISGNYGPNLEYLDLTGCTGITHYGLCCFYRFQKLKVLNLTGIEQSPEFKLSCLMIQDLLPDLQIRGVDYSEYMEDKDKIIEDIETENTDLSTVNN